MLTFDNYRLDQDENNYIVQQRMKRKNGDTYYKNIAYYGIGQLDLALQNVLMRKIHAADKDELRHVLKVLCEAKLEIMEAVKNV